MISLARFIPPKTAKVKCKSEVVVWGLKKVKVLAKGLNGDVVTMVGCLNKCLAEGNASNGTGLVASECRCEMGVPVFKSQTA